MSKGKLVLAVAFMVACGQKLSASEPDMLRLGMRPFEAVSVYTALRSCSSAPFYEQGQTMGWEGRLYSGTATIELQYDQGSAFSIQYTILPDTQENLEGLFQQVLADRIKVHGQPAELTRTSARWPLADGWLYLAQIPHAVRMSLSRREP